MLNLLRKLKHHTIRSASNIIKKWAEKRVVSQTNGVVISGAFKGVHLTDKHVFGSQIPKLLGSYEKELSEFLSSALMRQPAVVCNIGAAEGYYTIGCAQYECVERVIAFEALKEGRNLIDQNIRINKPNCSIQVRGLCDENKLWHTLQDTHIDLMLVDIEGAELELFSERNIHALQDTEVLIESHDFCRPGCLEKLTNMFGESHRLEVFESKIRTISDFPSQISAPKFLKLKLMDEMRPGTMAWLACHPKNIDLGKQKS